LPEAAADLDSIVAVPAALQMRRDGALFLLADLTVQIKVNDSLYIVTDH
jgi:hypothetical protein